MEEDFEVRDTPSRAGCAYGHGSSRSCQGLKGGFEVRTTAILPGQGNGT
jgi:hypothetical protein